MDFKRVDMFLTLDDNDFSLSFGSDTDDDFDHGILILSYEGIREVYQDLATDFSKFAVALDLTGNDIRDLGFLKPFNKLESLVLDKNRHLDMETLPYMKSLQLLWLNGCCIQNVESWIEIIRSQCPRLKHLAMMNNPGAKSLVNHATKEVNRQFRTLVSSRIRGLTHLDEATVPYHRSSKEFRFSCPSLFDFKKSGPITDAVVPSRKRKWRHIFRC